MKAKIILVFVFLFFLFGIRYALADVVISEIMYDLDGSDTVSSKSREWVEIYNSGPDAVEITGDWRFNDGSSHYLNDKTPFSIPANEYVVLAGDKPTFLIDYPSFSGVVVDTSVSLNNSGGTVKILDANGESISSIDYTPSQGASGDGNSLQLIDGLWKACTPSPGTANSACDPVVTTSDSSEGDTTEVTSSSSTSSSSSSGGVGSSSSETKTKTKTKVVENPTMKAKILANTTAFTGQPIELGASILGYSNENIMLGTIFWNFGDGETLEQVNKFDKFYHTYLYPGEYPVLLDYYSSSFSKVPDASSKIVIKVLSTTVSISRIGDARDLFIELSNNATSDIDISNWQVRAGGKIFILPRNSLILSKKKMTIPGRVNKLVSSDDLKLYSSTGELVYDYNNEYDPTEISESEESPKVAMSDVSENLNSKISGKNLLANAEAASEGSLSPGKSKNSSLFFISLILLLVLSGGAVYFIRQKKKVIQAGDNFEILDE